MSEATKAEGAALAPLPSTVPPIKTDLALIRPIAAVQVQLEMQRELEGVLRSLLKKGVDYGTTPGTKTPSLYKSGAERICLAFGAHAEFECIEKDVDHSSIRKWQKRKREGSTWNVETGEAQGFYRFVYRCFIKLNSTGAVLATEDGACSTAESKYCDRPTECENTVLKMAQKRAFVGAVLRAFGLSNRFAVGDDEAERERKPQDLYRGTKEERAQLDVHLGEQDVPREFWDEVSVALTGKPRTQCGSVIAAVLKRHEEPAK